MAARRHDALRHALGDEITAALLEPLVTEILVNPDGRLLLDIAGAGRRDTGTTLASDRRDRIIRLAADHVGETISPDRPRLSASLPGGERFQAFTPPVTIGPAFSIRKRAERIIRLGDYVARGAMSADQARVLEAAVKNRRNILVSGGTGAGKTTLANALLAEPGFSQDRVFIIEDTPELQCAAVDRVETLTRSQPYPVGVADLVRDAMRMRPDRIVIGEMREGAAALETLKAWNTGHPGGLSTLHANSAKEAISRLEDLLSEVMAAPANRRQLELIAHAPPKRAYYCRQPHGRRLFDLRLSGAGLALCGAASPDDQRLIDTVLADAGPARFARAFLKAKGAADVDLVLDAFEADA